MSPAEELRAAATKLRQTAAKATEGPWQMDGPYWWHEGDCTYTITDARNRWSVAVMPRREESPERRDHDAAWIALASPALAEPLGDLLDLIADQYEREPCDDPTGVCNRCESDPTILAADLVADALNGETQ